jgi:acyl dehydratase
MLPESALKLVGRKHPVKIYDIERGAIRKFAAAVHDPNPLYWDDEVALDSRYGTTPAPPGFFGWPTRWGVDDVFPGSLPKTDFELGVAMYNDGYQLSLDGSIEIEYFLPVMAGDRLAGQDELIGVTEREGKAGAMAFGVVKTTFINQNGALVATVLSTTIYMKTGEENSK